MSLGTFSNYDDDGSENITKKINLRAFKLYGVYLDQFNSSNVGDKFGVEFSRALPMLK